MHPPLSLLSPPLATTCIGVHYPTSGELSARPSLSTEQSTAPKPPSRARKTSMFVYVPMVTNAPRPTNAAWLSTFPCHRRFNGCIRPLVAHAARSLTVHGVITVHFHMVLSRFHGRQTVQGRVDFPAWLSAFHGCKRPICQSCAVVNVPLSLLYDS